MKAQNQAILSYLSFQTKRIAKLYPRDSSRSAHGVSMTMREVHKLRGAIKRVAAVLWMLELSKPHHKTRKVLRRLDKLGGKLGQIREVDVAIRDSHHLGVPNAQLLELKKLRIKRARRFPRGGTLLTLLKEYLKHLKNKLSNQSNAGSIVLKPAADRIFLELKKELRHPSTHPKGLHRLRVELKRPLYLLEALNQPRETLDQLQSILGDIHDTQTLEKTLKHRGFYTNSIEKSISNKKLTGLTTKLNHIKTPTLRQLMRQLDPLLHPDGVA